MEQDVGVFIYVDPAKPGSDVTVKAEWRRRADGSWEFVRLIEDGAS